MEAVSQARGKDVEEFLIIDPAEVAPCSPVTDLADETTEASKRKILTAYSVHQDPQVSVVPDFIQEAEIQHLLDLASPGWEPSEVGQGVYRTKHEGQDLANQVSDIRTSYSCLIEPAQSAVVNSIEQRLAALADLDVKYLEPLNMVRYCPGQFFKEHHDGRFRPVTIFIYLNDVPPGGGGETMFPDLKLKIVPRRGCAVMWNNTLGPQREDKRMVHQGLPPHTATKFGVNCFFNDKPMRRFVHEGDLPPPSPDISDKPSQLCRARTTLDPLLLAQQNSLPDVVNGSAKPSTGLRLRRLRVSKDPALWIVPEVVSTHEAGMLMDKVDKQLGRLPPHGRRSTGSSEELEELLADLQERLRAAAGSDCQLESLELRRLGPDVLRGAAVVSPPVSAGPARAAYLFLNDIPDGGGGELFFPQMEFKVLAREGFAVVWEISNSLRSDNQDHFGLPPTHCARYGASCIFSMA
mmetsp:Transcript_24214/g.45734  ORF Transcript_24214/g.45734 Transcript_24214/m.45734 type:complete len:465 (-) Transcript_24214:13-1407(-)